MRDIPTDPLDVANEATQAAIDRAISLIRKNQEETRLKPRGRCYNCEEKVLGKGLFCDGDCRDDYQYREERRRHQ